MTAPLPASLRLCLRRRRVPAPSGATIQVSLTVPSDVACIEEVVDLLVRHCCGDSWLCRKRRFNLRVAIAEALANAIVAGNQEDRSKTQRDLPIHSREPTTIPDREPVHHDRLHRHRPPTGHESEPGVV